MMPQSRFALELLLAAGAVVASGGAASAEAPPCQGWRTAAAHADAQPIASFESFCNGEEGAQAFPKKFEF